MGTIYSFGFRHGLPACDYPPKYKQPKPIIFNLANHTSKLVVDVRQVLPVNPYHNKKLWQLRGDSPEVIEELERTPDLDTGYAKILYWAKQQIPVGNVYVGCTGGHHRSVYIANRLGKDLGAEVVHLNYNDK